MNSCIGKSVRRVDAEDKVTGKAKYAADLFFDGMIHVKAVRSSFPHAKILGADTRESAAVPGVRAVLTSGDIPGAKLYGFPKRDHPVMAYGKVRYLGEAVAIIGGDTKSACEEAARRLKVTYEELPGVFSPAEALAAHAPGLHDDGNEIQRHKVLKGDTVRGFADSDAVIEGRFTTQFVEHAYMEPECVVAVPQKDGSFTVHGSMQSPFNVRQVVCETLGLSPEKVRVIQAVTGGAFGGKDDIIYEMAAQAALVSMKTGRPAKFVLSRDESMVASYKRHPMEMKYRLGAMKDGTLVSLEADILADGGAYAAMSPFVIWRSCVHASGPYEIPNVRVSGLAVYTNNTYTGPMRGFGAPQVTFAMESMIDMLAGKLGIDPIDLRLRNALAPGRTTATGQILNCSVGLRETLLAVREKSGWDAKRKSPGPATGKMRGIGVACCYHGVSLGAEGGDFSSAVCGVDKSGDIFIGSGLTDYGTGTRTVFVQIASEVLGVPVERIRVLASDTSLVPDSGPTVASRTTTLGGNAMMGAALALREKILSVAGGMLGRKPDELALKDGRIQRAEAHVGREPVQDGGRGLRDNPAGRIPSGELTLDEIAVEAVRRNVDLKTLYTYNAPAVTWNEEKGSGDAYFAYSFGTQAAEVEVDVDTGRVKVLNIYAAHDAGKAINPRGVEGQIRGGAVMGMGFGLYERVEINKGVTRNRNFDGYTVPTSLDSPDVIPIIVETVEPAGPFGAKGAGEPPVLPTAAAIANAVYAATGRRVVELPLSPEKILAGSPSEKN